MKLELKDFLEMFEKVGKGSNASAEILMRISKSKTHTLSYEDCIQLAEGFRDSLTFIHYLLDVFVLSAFPEEQIKRQEERTAMLDYLVQHRDVLEDIFRRYFRW